MATFFITSPGTGIGKTLVTAALCHQLRAAGKKVAAIKPMASGYDPDDMESDTALILKSCGIAPTLANAEKISPWRYKAALAPPMAAEKEGRPVDFNALLDFTRRQAMQKHDALLVEGVGGVMAPITGHHTMIDWMTALGWPVILVAGNYLGSISHTLTAIETIKNQSLPVKAVVVSESAGSTVPLAESVSCLEKFLTPHIPIVTIPRLATVEPLWQQVPNISWLCNT